MRSIGTGKKKPVANSDAANVRLAGRRLRRAKAIVLGAEVDATKMPASLQCLFRTASIWTDHKTNNRRASMIIIVSMSKIKEAHGLQPMGFRGEKQPSRMTVSDHHDKAIQWSAP